MDVEILIKDYVTSLTGKDDIDVEIIEDTVVLSRNERWHIYLIPGDFTMIGCFIDEDIRYIYDSRKDEAVQ